MNDLFRRDPPRLRDDEDRRVWERVRAAATRPVPWWAALWARPAVRYGLPAVAVVLVAVVWVAVEQPASTHRPAPPRAVQEEARPAAPVPMPPTTAEPQRDEVRERQFAATPPERRVAKQGAVGGAIAAKKEAEDTRSAKTMRLLGAGSTARNEAPLPPVAVTESAPAPVSAPAPAPAAPGVAASNAPSRVSTWGANKGQYRGDSISAQAAPVPLHVRGGRVDEMQFQVDGLSAGVLQKDSRAKLPTPTLDAVAGLVTRGPLQFVAPLPVRTQGGAGDADTVRIDLDAAHVARARLVRGGGDTRPDEEPPRMTYARFEDAGRTEQILLVAYAADRVMARGTGSRLLPALVARARQLADAGGVEETAARALLARLEHNAGGASDR